MKAVIAEKPSVAREDYSLVRRNRKKMDTWRGNGYLVTWALGHLVGLAMPEIMGCLGFQRILPIIPAHY